MTQVRSMPFILVHEHVCTCIQYTRPCRTERRAAWQQDLQCFAWCLLYACSAFCANNYVFIKCCTMQQNSDSMPAVKLALGRLGFMQDCTSPAATHVSIFIAAVISVQHTSHALSASRCIEETDDAWQPATTDSSRDWTTDQLARAASARKSAIRAAK